ncbi:MAG: NfeD family protein [Desulfomonilia bacterium]|nr:NfeD family protein [Desulfomonilia bacterium]
MYPREAIKRYTIIQLLELVAFVGILILIWSFIRIPLWVMIILVALWIGKDIVLFPLVWRAYEGGHAAQADPMIGMQGVALSEIQPTGYVEVRGERWKAELIPGTSPLKPGEKITVTDISGLKLLVKHADLG